MESRTLLDQMLQAGQELVKRGRNVTEQKFGVPEAGPEREAMLSGMGKGAAIAGVAALLVGTGAGRRMGAAALKLGSVAALGGLAYKAYQNWQRTQAQAVDALPVTPISELGAKEAEKRSLVLLRAMISAAKADGHIDTEEQARLDVEIEKLGFDAETLHFVKEEIARPVNVEEIAAAADSQESAAEIYLASLAVIDVDNYMERGYLDELAKRLKLAPGLVQELEAQLRA